jgi:peptidoglycan DL-endopeptidase RipA
VFSGTRIGRPRAGSARQSGRRRAVRGAGTTVVAVLTFGLLAGLAPGTATATPGDAAIAEARAQADEVTSRIGELSGRITAAQDEVAAARAASAIALDTVQATRAEEAAARTRAAEATAAADQALADLGVARGDVVDFARRSYMDGSSYAGAAALITSGSPAEFIERAALLEAAGAHRTDVLVVVTDLQAKAERAQTRATVALAQAETLKRQAENALAVAAEAEASARQQAAALAVQQAELETELAAAEEQLTALVGAQEAAERTRREREQATQATPPAAPAPTSGGNDRPAGPGSSRAAATAIAAAKAHLGLSYAWGGGGTNGPGWGWGIDDGVWGFDCSGLTQYAYAQAGIAIPRNSRAQYAELPKVGSASLRAGDLVFWATDPGNPQTIHHVAIYLGNGSIVEAPQSGDVVKISPMRWGGYAGAVRPGG